ncbi:DUF748 domain-containing protein, partial [Chromobacterium alticapitis]
MNTAAQADTASPSPAPRKSRRWLRWLAVAFALLLACWAFLGLAAPKLLQQAASDWARKHGRQLAIAEVRIVPWSMELTLNGVALREGDGRPLFQARRLYLNADLHALLFGRWQASEFTLDSPQLWLDRDSSGRWNWEKFASDISGPARLDAGSTPEKLPRLTVNAINLRDGQIRLSDHETGQAERFRLMPINLSLSNLSTLAENGRYALHAELEGGGRFDWRGSMQLQPLQSSGEAHIGGLPLATAWDYVKPYFHADKPEGALTVDARYQLDLSGKTPELTVSSLSASLQKLKLKGPDGAELTLPELKVEGGALDLSHSLLTVQRVELNGGRLSAGRDAAGRVNWLRALPESTPAPAAPAKPSPWMVKLESIRLTDWRAAWSDQAFAQPLKLETAIPRLQTRLTLDPERGLRLEQAGLSLADLTLSAAGGQPWLSLQGAELAPSLLDMKRHSVKPGDIALSGLKLSLQRERDGKLQLQKLLAQRPRAPAAQSAK